MDTNTWKKVGNIIYFIIGSFCLEYILDTLLFKFGFEQTAPKFFHNLSSSIVISILIGIFSKKIEIKKRDIYFLIIIIILAIAVYFFVLNWHLKLIMLY